jgi:hypothetical protein
MYSLFLELCLKHKQEFTHLLRIYKSPNVNPIIISLNSEGKSSFVIVLGCLITLIGNIGNEKKRQKRKV